MPEQSPDRYAFQKKRKSAVWNRLIFALRIVISISLLAYLLLVTVPPESRIKIVELLIDSDLLFLFLAVALVFAERLVSSWKWLALLRVREPDLGLWQIIQIIFVTTFLGYFLPSSIGGDIIRAYSMSRINRDLAGSASSVVIDRALGTLGLLAIAAVAIIPAVGAHMSVTDAAVVWAFTAAVLCGVLLLCSRRIHSWFWGAANLSRRGPIRSRIAKLVHSASEYVGRKWTVIQVFLFSLLVQFIRVTIAICLGFSLGLQAQLLDYFIFIPIITVITFLPISIAGVGVRELSFVFFFARVGVPEYACISLSLLYFAMGIVGTLPGAVIYIFTGLGRREVGQEAAG